MGLGLGLSGLGRGCVMVRMPVRKARRTADGAVLEGEGGEYGGGNEKRHGVRCGPHAWLKSNKVCDLSFHGIQSHDTSNHDITSTMFLIFFNYDAFEII